MFPQHAEDKVLIIDDELASDTAGGLALREVISRLKMHNYGVLETLTGGDGVNIFGARSDIVCVIVDWVLLSPDELLPDPREVIEKIRRVSKTIPVFIASDKLGVDAIPRETIGKITGYIWKLEDTPEFIAGRIHEAIQSYLDSLLPPFFKSLVNYVHHSMFSWHTPGHSGGNAFLKAHAGRRFFDFFGENTLRADLSVSVPELGSLLDHTGPIAKAEEYAAGNFNADRTYFVTNGTSTSNKIVFHALIKSGERVLVDRNCHKSVVHSITMTGAKVDWLVPQRNELGLIGPIPLEEFEKKISKDVKLIVVTNSTYDGLAYNVKKIVRTAKHNENSPRTLNFLFDEAWFGYAKFHDIYHDRFAMGIEKSKLDEMSIFATQSTHKVLAALSQGSMIHVKSNSLSHERFNEAYMMHTSTSPQYGIIASLDMATKIMDNNGKHLLEGALEESIIFRQKVDQIFNSSQKDWFRCWQPDVGRRSSEDLISKSGLWTLKPEDKETWHGFRGVTSDDYVMLDPCKVTVVTKDLGIPAYIVAKFLNDNGVVVEKTGFYTFLILFTIGITRGKSGTLIALLEKFKEMYDDPRDSTLRDLSAKMANFRFHELAFTNLPEKPYQPREAFEKFIAGDVEKVGVNNRIKGRISATTVVPYPPGIPVIMPGEIFDEEVAEYLESLVSFNSQFGKYDFQIDIHGVDAENRIFCLKE